MIMSKMTNNSYHDTTKGRNSAVYELLAKSQDEIIKVLIIQVVGSPFSPKDIYNNYPSQSTPLTSIRRSLTKLKKEGFIEETGNRVPGLYGRDELELKVCDNVSQKQLGLKFT